MTVLLVVLAALLASTLTFFTGFGLGTLLLPVFALFFPLPAAVAMTSLVHFSAGLSKLALLGRHVSWPVVLRFGLPAMLAAFLGARTLLWLAGTAPLATYHLGGRLHEVTTLKVLMGCLLIAFSFMEASGVLAQRSVPPRWLPAGGLLSGFFGGLSGSQGPFRAPFLLRAGLGKEAFIASGATIGALVDVSRMGVYLKNWSSLGAGGSQRLIILSMGAAFLGSVVGNHLLTRTTMKGIQWAVECLLVVVAILMGSGLI